MLVDTFGRMLLISFITLLSSGSATASQGVSFTAGNTISEVDKSGAVAASSWLETQRSRDFGWGEDTARCITALQLHNSSWHHSHNQQSQISVKEMELELILALWNHRIRVVTSSQLAEFILALLSVCKDPHDFHGRDLVSLLQRQEPELNYDFAFHNLALCVADGHIRRRHTRKLIEMVSHKTRRRLLWLEG